MTSQLEHDEIIIPAGKENLVRESAPGARESSEIRK